VIRTLLRVQAIALGRDRVSQVLSFVLPIAFFTVFALVFGGRGHTGTGRVRVAVVDESHTTVSARLVRAFRAEKGLRVITEGQRSARDTTRVPLDRPAAEALVRKGTVPVALVLPAGVDTALMRFGGGGTALLLLSDPSDPVAAQMVGGLLQKVAMTGMPDLFMRSGVAEFERYGGGLTPAQSRAVSTWTSFLATRDSGATAPSPRPDSAGAAGARDSTSATLSGLVRVEERPVLGRREDSSLISFYAAGIAVMFLLFTASAVAGTLLDETDSGTLERVLSTRLGMTRLLAGKWLFVTLLGMLQIAVMFVYGMLVFRLDLLRHLPGFVVMTALTASVTSAFGLLLATLCRTRAQLGGLSTLVILLLSALGGSMFPRFLMSETMQRIGLVTFNAWALDGFVKVFWRDAALRDLGPQAAVLGAFIVGFLLLARLFARRWERV
jgi:ABC-2 type transport system permease protein